MKELSKNLYGTRNGWWWTLPQAMQITHPTCRTETHILPIFGSTGSWELSPECSCSCRNTLPRVKFFHWGNPTSNDWPLWGIKACLLSLISDNPEGTVQKRSSPWYELSSEAHPTPAPPCCFQCPLLFNKLPANLYLRLFPEKSNLWHNPPCHHIQQPCWKSKTMG